MNIEKLNQADDRILRKLEDYNNHFEPKVNYKPVIFQATENGKFLGGLDGHIAWDTFEINNLIVEKRNQGIATQLMQEAENFAKAHGANKIIASTLSFQAPRFYKKCGFVEFCTLPNFAGKHTQHYFMKRLENLLA